MSNPVPVGQTGAVTVQFYGRVALVCFDRRESADNVLSVALANDLTDAIRRLGDDRGVAALVLTGKPHLFCGGGAPSQTDPAMFDRDGADSARRLIETFAQLEPATLVAVEGACRFEGLALAAVADFRVSGAAGRFAARRAGAALDPLWQAVPRLSGLARMPACRPLIEGADEITPAAALDAQLIDEVVPSGLAVNAALRWGQSLASQSALPMKMAKLAINAAAHHQGGAGGLRKAALGCHTGR
jgi:enoyl-CoA hydratase/carnithine racemase